jgi:phage terminase Nu1 subunit (DNA packaging protein)
VNKTACCQHFRWSRFQFDKNVAAGMPVVQAAGHKGDEWKIDLTAVARWLRELEEAAAARHRLRQERERERREELERAVAKMSPRWRKALLPRWGR